MKMRKAVAGALVALSCASLAHAAAPDCASGYKTFLGKISPYIVRADAEDLTDFMERGLGAYDACMAGDDFSPHGVWDEIARQMEKQSKK